MDRRTFLTGLGLISLQPSLQGCSWFLPKPNPRCLFDQHTPTNNGLLIDTHAHFFNGSDLQVSAFVKQVAGRELVDWMWLRDVAGDLLQLIAWNAPTAQEELNLIRQAKSCSPNLQNQLLTIKRDEQFSNAKNEFLMAVEKQIALGTASSFLVETPNLSEILPQSYDTLYAAPDEHFTAGTEKESSYRKIRAAFRFVVEMFQYRYVSANNYLKIYNSANRKIDIVVSHLVDYDWFLTKGKKTPSSIPQQIQLMGEIAKLSSGVVNYFAPYCPLRHVAWDSGQTVNNFDPLEQEKSAIEMHGALGVKIYPPMGFALWGNEALQKSNPNLWRDREFLPEIRKDVEFGKKLDEKLASLYRYCEENNVPIMAHTAISNLSDSHFNVIFNFDSLNKLVTTDYPSLKISFGHFGGFGWANDKNEGENKNQANPAIWPELVNTMSNSANNNLYVDTGFFSAALGNEIKFKKSLRDLLSKNPFLANKMLYGTDWKMLVTEEKTKDYLQTFERILHNPEIEKFVSSTQRQNILGKNGAAYLGLYAGSISRTRVERFYQNQVQPHWISKL